MKFRKRIALVAVLMATMVFASVSVEPVAAYSQSTHDSMIIRAVSSLTYANCYDFDCDELYLYKSDIEAGSAYADDEQNNPDRPYHYHGPDTHLGFLPLDFLLLGWWGFLTTKSAGECANDGIERAIESYSNNKSEAYFWIGYAVHMVQDLTVPHHADIVDGGVRTHVEYEFYCVDNNAPIYAETSGLFTFDSFEAGGKTHCDPNTAFGWVDYAAHQSKPYHDMCRVDTKDYATASQYLLPLGTRLTVGFLLWAYHILNPSADVDRDGLSYTEEIALGTLPWSTDSDGDTMPDDWEVDWGFNPASAGDKYLDRDSDGLKNYLEYKYNCFPSISDSDGDTMKDGWEVTYGLNPCSSSDKYADKDGDGLKNYLEYSRGTNPTKSDTDGDGLNDYNEIYTYGTSPTKFDTDGDGYGDGWEIANGYDPLNYYSKPAPPPGPIFIP